MEETRKAPTGAGALTNEYRSSANKLSTAKVAKNSEYQANKDFEFTIAEGKSCNCTDWKNTPYTWTQLTERLSHTKRTPETVAQYNAMSKTERNNAKDVGGFVGGELISDGRRSSSTVKSRRLLTLDLDSADDGTLGRIGDELLEESWVVYSTHSHTPEAPRYRLIVPLDRDVTPDEYGAISRKLAERIGIDQFDKSTYQPERLMYWPSTSKDGEFIFREGKGAPLCADEMLAEWPLSSGETKIIEKHGDKLEDPTLKPGIIGAFCRTYSIPEALERFLPEVYGQAEGQPDRYTYLQGSTAGGLQILEGGKWAHSYHGSDPAGGGSHNAFDLVRIHKFGGLDENVAPDTPINKLPSYRAMVNFANSDPRTAEQLQADAVADFANTVTAVAADMAGNTMGLTIEPPTVEVVAGLNEMALTVKGGKVEKTLDNLDKLLEKDPNVGGRFAYDSFTHEIEIHGGLPGLPLPEGKSFSTMTSENYTAIRCYMSRAYHVDFSEDNLRAVTELKAKQRSHSSAADYYITHRGIWNGERRIDTLIIDCLDAEDNPLTRAMTRKFFCACVARALDPGCKFDYVLLLIGPEGIKKTTFFQNLCPKDEWFSSDLPTFDTDSQKLGERLEGKLILEIGELSQYKRTDSSESFKNVVTRRADTYRPAYGHDTGTYPRQSVFVATTNQTAVLRGSTGNRRFWPIEVRDTPEGRRKVDELRDLRDQIWAEAVYYYDAGEPLYLSDEMEAQVRLRQEGHNEITDSPLLDQLRELGRRTVPVNFLRLSLPIAERWMRGDRYYLAEPSDQSASLELGPLPPLPLGHIEAFLGLKRDKDRSRLKQALKVLGCTEKVYHKAGIGTFRGYQLPLGEDEVY